MSFLSKALSSQPKRGNHNSGNLHGCRDIEPKQLAGYYNRCGKRGLRTLRKNNLQAENEAFRAGSKRHVKQSWTTVYDVHGIHGPR